MYTLVGVFEVGYLVFTYKKSKDFLSEIVFVSSAYVVWLAMVMVAILIYIIHHLRSCRYEIIAQGLQKTFPQDTKYTIYVYLLYICWQ